MLAFIPACRTETGLISSFWFRMWDATSSPRDQPAATSRRHRSTARIVAILECLDRSGRGLNISEMSRKLGIPKSSTHAIVVTLETLGFLDKRKGGRYGLGSKAIVLGQGRKVARA
jgi:DNA-binding MarR family transcriptional regulator